VPDLPDINAPLPDLAHELLRQEVVAAIAQLADHVQQLSDSFLLGQTAADFARTALNAVNQLQAMSATQANQITDLQKRVAALEAAQPAPAPAPTPAPTPAAMTASETPVYDGMNLEA
jgi:hypothetical protein